MAQTPSVDFPEAFSFRPIGRLESCFKEKFGIPRQPGLVKEAWANLHLPKTEEIKEALFGLETFSHVWLVFVFDRAMDQGWSARVRPPRLGGDRSVGVFASRSPFRPNPIGLSVVELRGIDADRDHWILRLGGTDCVDGTPILDIKPYLPYVDSVLEANQGWLPESWEKLKVDFSEVAKATIDACPDGERLRKLICACLEQDPRPAYKRNQSDIHRLYGFRLESWDIKFKVSDKVYVQYLETMF